ncbi:MAG: HD domain-containing protein [Vulcanimicrobiaceae bacterium]
MRATDDTMTSAMRDLDARLARTVPPGALFAVGGRVRDEIRTRIDGIAYPAKDLDYVVVGVELDDLVARLRRVGRADVVGASFAVVKATIDDTTVDVALPRRERSTGTGHRDFVVEWGADVPLVDDLARRDFRMNMLARSLPDGDLVDPYGGAADIHARRIDVLREAAFREDPLRMLRACQFAARFEYDVSPATFDAMVSAAPLVATVSAERVRDELEKFVRGARQPSIGIELMRRTGLLAHVLPEVAAGIDVPQNAFHAYDVYAHNLATLDATPSGDLTLRFAALLHDVAKPQTRCVDESGTHFYGHENVGADVASALLDRLRFSSDVVRDVRALVKHHMYAADPALEAKALRRFVRRVGVEALEWQFALRAADIVGSGLPKRDDANERFEANVRAIVAERPALSTRDLAIDGRDVIEALIVARRLPHASRGGREVGRALAASLEWVTDDPARNERGLLLGFVRNWIESTVLETK